jgi:hypothetical protein
VARARPATTPFKLVDELEEPPQKKKKSEASDPREALTRVMSQSMKESDMLETRTIPVLQDLLGIHQDDTHSINACPLNAIPLEPMSPSGSELLDNAPSVELILEEVSARRLGSPQKYEGQTNCCRKR